MLMEALVFAIVTETCIYLLYLVVDVLEAFHMVTSGFSKCALTPCLLAQLIACTLWHKETLHASKHRLGSLSGDSQSPAAL